MRKAQPDLHWVQKQRRIWIIRYVFWLVGALVPQTEGQGAGGCEQRSGEQGALHGASLTVVCRVAVAGPGIARRARGTRTYLYLARHKKRVNGTP